MVEGLKFLNEFFTERKYDKSGVTITLDERPSFDISSEDYRCRVIIAEVIDEVGHINQPAYNNDFVYCYIFLLLVATYSSVSFKDHSVYER